MAAMSMSMSTPKADAEPLSPATTYRHIPIATDRAIRVLALEPAASRDAPLRGSLAQVSLAANSSYTALSYTWDTYYPSRRIECDGRGPLYITPNCESALRHLRRENDARLLWVDSICIDQASSAERSAQVGLMGDIFKGAEQVVAWLGEGTPDTDAAFDKLKRVDALVEGLGPAAREQFLRQRPEHSIRREISIVCSLPWFTRIWTAQEASIPDPRRVTLQCGDVVYPWLAMLHKAELSGEPGALLRARYLQATNLQHMVVELLHDCSDGGATHESWLETTQEQQSKLLPILRFTRSKIAFMLEDKIYGIYGMLKQAGFQLPPPDYRKPLSQIYAEAAVACIKSDGSLNVLTYVPTDRRLALLPSWVPDWSDTEWELFDSRRRWFRWWAAPTVAAGGPQPATWRILPDFRSLVVLGRVLDTVHECCPPVKAQTDMSYDEIHAADALLKVDFPGGEPDAFAAVQRLSNCVAAASRHHCYPDEQAKRDAFRKVVERSTHASPDWDRGHLAFTEWFGIMEKAVVDGVTFSLDWLNAQNLQTGFVHHEALAGFCKNRCFFTTEAGVYGMSVVPILPGDRVAIIQGYGMPVILREFGTTGTSQYICYTDVEGIMQGEAATETMYEITLV